MVFPRISNSFSAAIISFCHGTGNKWLLSERLRCPARDARFSLSPLSLRPRAKRAREKPLPFAEPAGYALNKRHNCESLKRDFNNFRNAEKMIYFTFNPGRGS
jgi:hypothetical protein